MYTTPSRESPSPRVSCQCTRGNVDVWTFERCGRQSKHGFDGGERSSSFSSINHEVKQPMRIDDLCQMYPAFHGIYRQHVEVPYCERGRIQVLIGASRLCPSPFEKKIRKWPPNNAVRSFKLSFPTAIFPMLSKCLPNPIRKKNLEKCRGY
ncbi:hypothetical protein BJV74DRAFT_129401 [Russula compacta]|nr:hypothetical protein BJV74DRAFT_129401 [Russula compacta]